MAKTPGAANPSTSSGAQSFGKFFRETTPAASPSSTTPAARRSTSARTFTSDELRAVASAEGLSATQQQVFDALIGQESGYGANSRTSTDGAMGAGQVMPGTFRQYAKPGESIDNPADNLRVAARIVRDLGQRSGDDPARIATGYFSGPGNIATGGSTAWKSDHADGNGKRVSSYVTDVLARLTGAKPAQAAEQQQGSGLDLSGVPKWTSVAGKDEYRAMNAETRTRARNAYFNAFIAPKVSAEQRAQYRTWFEEQAQKMEPPEPTSMLRRAGDLGVAAVKGIVGVPEALTGLADLATGGRAGKALQELGVDFKATKEIADRFLSPAQQAADKKVADAEGFVDTAGAMLANPSTISQAVVESAPSMLGGAGAGRAILAAAPKVGAVMGAAAGEGVFGAGAAAESIRQQSDDGLLSAKQAGAALASGAGTALFGAAGGRLAKKLGIADIDTVLVQGGAPAGSSKNAIRRMIEGGISEGALEELPQSMQEQVWQNAALDKPLLEGVPEAAAQGLITGAAMGAAGGGALTRRGPAPEVDPEVAPPPAADVRIEPTMGDDAATATPPAAAAPTPAAAATPATAAAPTDADRDVLDYAATRYQQLRTKRDGELGDDGLDLPGSGLSDAEQQELAGLEANRGNARALAEQYGFDLDAPTAEAVAAAANEAATSPTNDLPEPTAAQKENGNYRKGRVKLHGLDVAIENPAGSTRRGTDPNGTPWENTLKNHYGYVRGTKGADGDAVDVFVGPAPQSSRVFVVDQIDPDTGRFDEVKALLGFTNQQDAEAAYQANYAQGWNGMGNVTEVPVDGFKSWLNTGDTSKPFGEGQFMPAEGAAPKAPDAKVERRQALDSYNAAIEAGDEAAADEAMAALSRARQSADAAAASAAETAQKQVDDATKKVAQAEAAQQAAAAVEKAKAAAKPKTEKEARAKRAAKTTAKEKPNATRKTDRPVAGRDGGNRTAAGNGRADGRPAGGTGSVSGSGRAAAAVDGSRDDAAGPAGSNAADAGAALKRQPVTIIHEQGGRGADVAKTLAQLPPVADGHVRLFRAESPTVKFSDVFDETGLADKKTDLPGKRYTPDLKYADYYRKSYGKDAAIYYVDVPKDVANKGRLDETEYVVDVDGLNGSKEVGASPAAQALIAEAVQKKIITPGSLRAERYRAGIMDAADGKAPAQAERSYIEGHAWASKKVAKPAGKAAYSLPDDINADWKRVEAKDFQPSARQKIVMDAVEKAKAAGAFYTSDVTDHVAKTLNVGADIRGINKNRVDGGDFGYDVYFASKAVDAQRGHAEMQKVGAQLNLKVGDKIGTVVFNDSKVNTGATVDAINGDTITLSGKRGAYTVKMETNPISIKWAIDRAKEKGKRKDGFDEYVAAKTAAPAKPKLKRVPVAKVESTAQGMLATARQYKAAAFKRVKDLRQEIKEAGIGGKSALRLELIKAESRWNEYKQMERDALSKIEEDAQQQGNTTIAADDVPELNDIERDRRRSIEVAGVRRPIENSKGQVIVQDFNKQLAFYRWFGDSKVVDSKGRPLVVYHGTNADFAEFDTGLGQLGTHFGTIEQANRILESHQRGDASIMPAYLSIQNPLRLRDTGTFGLIGIRKQLVDLGIVAEPPKSTADAMAAIKDAGYDGIVYANEREGSGDSWIAFNSKQIKSATGNTGRFDPDDASIVNDIDADDIDLTRGGPLERQPEQKRINGLARLKRLQKRLADGKLTEAEYAAAVQQLTGDLEQQANQRADTRLEKETRPRERGELWIRERLLRAKRTGELDAEQVDLALWALDQNPALATDLGISLRDSKGDGIAGSYIPGSRIINLIRGNGNTETVLHEIMHHTERMMPPEVQQGIVKEWSRAMRKAWMEGSPEIRAGIESMIESSMGSREAHGRMMQAFRDGVLKYEDHYHLVNASEYWAVKASELLARRADSRGWVARAKTWLAELVERLRGLLKLPSSAPVLAGIRAIMAGNGKRLSNAMLVEIGNGRASAVAEPNDIDTSLFDITRPRTAAQKAQQQLVDEFGKPSFGTIDWWDKSVGTQYHKAAKNPKFKKVFDLAVARENAVSLTALRPAELAPTFLPRIDDFKGALRTLAQGRKTGTQSDLAGKALLEGTLAGDSVIDGRVWTTAELRAKGLNDEGIAMYRQAREAINASLDEAAAAEAYSIAHSFIPKSLRDQILDEPVKARKLIGDALEKRIKMEYDAVAALNKKQAKPEVVDAAKERLRQSFDVKDKLGELFERLDKLQDAGYTPLMRFGKYFVQVEQVDPQTGKTVIDPTTGKPTTLYYARFETQAEAEDAYFRQQVANRGRDDVDVKTGVQNDEQHKLFAGITPETIELFGQVVGVGQATERFYQEALSERSAMKRRLERNAIEGYSQNMPRVLANFITSNARYASGRYYNRDLNQAIKYIPRTEGDVQKEAIRLKEYIDDPGNAGAIASALAFTWFLGGNVASAVVNATQPIMMTAPYLRQYVTGTKAYAALTRATPYAMGKKEITDPKLRAALKRGSQEGKVDAQEVFHLYSIGIQSVAATLAGKLSKLPVVGKKVKGAQESASARLNALGTLWGMPFALVEGFNRRLTFIAAWDVALQTNQPDPYAFAVDAIDQTQGIYNKVNRPNWARSSVGRVLFTFAQFKIMNAEIIKRMATMGGPEGKKAAAMYLATLILAAGASGIPYSDDLDDLIDTVGQWLGYNTNMKRTKREWAYKTLGDGFGDLALYGVSSHLPFDLGGRMGLGNMLPATGAAKPSNADNVGRELLEIAGPALGGLGGQFGEAFTAAGTGDYGAAFAGMMPTAVKNAVAGADMAVTGKAKDRAGKLKVEVDGVDAASKAIGFNPTKIAAKNRANMPIMQDMALQRIVEAKVLDQWAQGIAQKDQDSVTKAQARMADWNRKNPETPIAISAAQLKAKVKALLTPADQRLMQRAPKEMKARVVGGLADLD